MALSKTGHFLSKAEILGVGVFSPLPNYGYLAWMPSESDLSLSVSQTEDLIQLPLLISLELLNL